MRNAMTLLSATLIMTGIGAPSLSASERSKYDEQFASYPLYNGDDLELKIDSTGTHFRLWSPQAQEVSLNLYNTGLNGKPYQTIPMTFHADNGTWTANIDQQLYGKFYTFKVKQDGRWLDETPGVWAKAVGANGKRAAIIDFAMTNPEGWERDKGPKVDNFTDVIVYEMHHRDFSMSPTSGIANKGKFLALTETGTTSPDGEKTGIDHLKELGITHVHILPSYDYNSVDDTNLQQNIYN